MAEYCAEVIWQRGGALFTDNRYSRAHQVQFCGELLPTRAEIEAMHHSAHAECYIANSVSTHISIEPR